MMITYRSRFLARGELWFDNEPDDAVKSLDWLVYHQRSAPVPGTKSRPFYTSLVDLSQSREQLQARLNRDTAYKIRRARERDRITCEGCDPRARVVMDHFEQVYNTFAALKGLNPLDRVRLESLAAAGLLDLSAAKDPHGNVLVYHANYRDRSRASELALPSLYRAASDAATRNLIGRANRYLTWSDIVRYQDTGLRYFDFGGWYYGDDPARLAINDFKRGFGGDIVCEYECEQTLTWRGRFVLALAAVLNRARSAGARSRSHATADEKPTNAGEGSAPASSSVAPLAALEESKVSD